MKPWRLQGRWGFTRQPENSKREHLTTPALPNTTKKPREDTQRDKESETGGWRRKNGRNFGPPTLRGPRLRDPTFSRFGPPYGAPPFMVQKFNTLKLAEVEIGRSRPRSSARAGTDCVGHVIRTVTERQPDLIVLPIDGIGAYDHVYRSSIVAKLHEVPGLRKLLPFLRRAYSRPSRDSWVDGQGEKHWRETGGPSCAPFVQPRNPRCTF